MNKVIRILLGVMAGLMLFVLGFALYTKITDTPQKKEKLVNELFVTVKIDGQEYLWGQFHNGNILVPKTPKCSCDTIK
jgi:hypothetical protein